MASGVPTCFGTPSAPRCRRKSARERREQARRAEARLIGRLLTAADSLGHRGSRPSRLLDALAVALRRDCDDLPDRSVAPEARHRDSYAIPRAPHLLVPATSACPPSDGLLDPPSPGCAPGLGAAPVEPIPSTSVEASCPPSAGFLDPRSPGCAPGPEAAPGNEIGKRSVQPNSEPDALSETVNDKCIDDDHVMGPGGEKNASEYHCDMCDDLQQGVVMVCQNCDFALCHPCVIVEASCPPSAGLLDPRSPGCAPGPEAAPGNEIGKRSMQPNSEPDAQSETEGDKCIDDDHVMGPCGEKIGSEYHCDMCDDLQQGVVMICLNCDFALCQLCVIQRGLTFTSSEASSRGLHHVQALRSAAKHDYADAAVLEAFADRIRSAGTFRRGPSLSWDELEHMRFVKGSLSGMLYDRCCDMFHGGSKDPRDKTDSFLALFKDMRQL
jgi:hypothetical protein